MTTYGITRIINLIYHSQVIVINQSYNVPNKIEHIKAVQVAGGRVNPYLVRLDVKQNSLI